MRLRAGAASDHAEAFVPVASSIRTEGRVVMEGGSSKGGPKAPLGSSDSRYGRSDTPPYFHPVMSRITPNPEMLCCTLT